MNFDPDRFTTLIRQALVYRSQLKATYENSCKEQGKVPNQFLQTEATWTPDDDIWVGSTDRLEDEGSIHYN